MKFWELVSVFGAHGVLSEVLAQNPWLDWHKDFDRLVDQQDRSVLDQPVPLELSRLAASLCSTMFVYNMQDHWLRELPSKKVPRTGIQVLSAREVHDLFSGSAIWEVYEYGSVRVAAASEQT